MIEFILIGLDKGGHYKLCGYNWILENWNFKFTCNK